MIAILGNTLLLMAFAFTIYGILSTSLHTANGNRKFMISGERAILTSSLFVILSTIGLLIELLRSNFTLEYVAKYSSAETPTLYKFSGLWAGMKGSLLFWVMILSVFIIMVIFQNRNRHTKLMPWVLITLGVIQLFFLAMSNFFENPFTPIPAGMVMNGMGLNPLLQNPVMLIHPPLLYLGFIGFSVPFAFGMAAMITGELDTVWIRTTRRWTLITWLFLSVAIILGGRWAYVELGWGGYWAWDPVENASLLPWLTGTAYIHSVLIQEKKNMLRIWNMILIMVTFTLTIFGTYLTRSGIVSSVHAFAATDLGIWFFGFVMLILGTNIFLLILRRKELASVNKLESFVGRESGFLFNNMLFVAMMLTVLWGTMYPILSEALTGTKITVGSPYFNRVMVPLGLLLLFLTGIGPLLAWRRTTNRSLRRNFTVPLVVGLILAGIFGSIYKITQIYPLISILLISFVGTIIILEFYKGTRARHRMTGAGYLASFFQLLEKNRSRYGGYIVHLGIVMMFLGFTGKVFDKEADLSMNQGEVRTVGRYDIEYSDFWLETPETNPTTRSNHAAKIVTLKISRDGAYYTTLNAEKRFYTDQNNQPSSEVSLKATLFEDLYIVLGSLDLNSGNAILKVRVNHLVSWVWLGTFVLILGSLVSLNIGGLIKGKTL